MAARRAFWRSVAGAACAVLLYALAAGGDPRAALLAIDHGDRLLGDFQLYYLPQGAALASGSGVHLPGCYLTPGAAVCFAGLALLPAAVATWLYGGLSVAALAAAHLATRRAAGRPPTAAGWAALLLAAPVAHALHWGQTSTFATAAVALAAASRSAGTVAGERCAGMLLGVAVVAKPWALLAAPALLRTRAAWLGAGLAAGALGVALPVVVLGPLASWDWIVALVADVGRGRAHFAVDPNSQHVAHVVARYLRLPADARAGFAARWAPVGIALALGWAGVARRVCRGRAAPLAPLVALAAVPLLVPTAWPHDLQAASLLLAAALLPAAPPRAAGALVAWGAVWSVQSVLAVWLLGPRWFGALGLPLLACAGAVALVLRAGRSDATPAAAADS